MSDAETSWGAERLAAALQAQKRRLEEERRASFAPLGATPHCPWPASQVYHRHSSLGPAWAPILTDAEVEALTLDLSYKSYPQAPRIALPRPPALEQPLQSVIAARRTERNFSRAPLTLNQLASLLELGCGVTHRGDVPRRAAPSPGALYPVEAYPLIFGVDGLAPGLYHYAALDHALELVTPLPDDGAAKTFLPTAFHEAHPPLLIALTIVFARVQMKYLERGYRFALLEAGHVAQNMLLAATAMELASAPIGGFWDEPFNDLLGLTPDEEAVVYAIACGGRPITESNGGPN
jgi:SagB-type dehydrogenase family enzyme